ncbi:hypothetical protein QR680_008329 [Steinernema hermaphroditum]|uniref:Vta1/callose synthase N-terminal domain-containing protein n=1 Tax=Steinernema hermaphroditum TaxID=289476 RepID=A0AA39M7G3_9BILA|nr:hypothetical protein QR680_008329 [Steinernema hermaphroditum]
MSVPRVPDTLRSIANYMKLAEKFKNIDPVINYWLLYYVAQTTLSHDMKNPTIVEFFNHLVCALKQTKERFCHVDGVMHDQAAKEYIQQYALEVFARAEQCDKALLFNTNVVNDFYTAGLLLDVLQLFKEALDEDIKKYRKYAKWRSSYIYTVLRNGDTPLPGGGVDVIRTDSDSTQNSMDVSMGSLTAQLVKTTCNEYYGFDAIVIRKKMREAMRSSTLGMSAEDTEMDEDAVELIGSAASQQLRSCISRAFEMASCRTQSLERNDSYERIDDPRGQMKHLQEGYAQYEASFHMADKKEREDRARRAAIEREQRQTDQAALQAIGRNTNRSSSSANLAAVHVPRRAATTVRINERDLLLSMHLDKLMKQSGTRTLLLYRGFKRDS